MSSTRAARSAASIASRIDGMTRDSAKGRKAAATSSASYARWVFGRQANTRDAIGPKAAAMPEVLVVQDAGDQDGLATGERLRHRRGQGNRSGVVVGSIDDDERGLAYDFHPGRPPNGRNPGADRLVWKRKPGRAELLQGGNRDAQGL